METMSLPYALISMQNALLDVITPQLRAVVINLVGNVLYTRFYYDGEEDEHLIDLWQCAITEASAHMGVDCFTDSKEVRLDYPQKIPVSGVFAYLRKEPDVLNLYDLKKSRGFSLREDFFLVEDKGVKLKSYGPILLAVQRALLGVVTPQLRSVIVDFDDEKTYVWFYYDGEVSLEFIREWEDAVVQIGVDMGPTRLLDGHVERSDYPQEMPGHGQYAYSRKEG
jgi:hypothetical protein